jgi:glutaredoxin 3
MSNSSEIGEQMTEVVIYTQDWCPYCVRAKSILSTKGVSFTEIDAPGGSAERAESVARTGRTSVPQIFVGGQHIGGCDDLIALDRAGKLDPMLASA